MRIKPLQIALSQLLHIPSDIGAGLPCIQMYGDTECIMDYHRGILAYDPQKIVVQLRRGVACLEGENLQLQQMHKEGLLIRGTIRSFTFLEGAS